jgi:hypothetical protein
MLLEAELGMAVEVTPPSCHLALELYEVCHDGLRLAPLGDNVCRRAAGIL